MAGILIFSEEKNLYILIGIFVFCGIKMHLKGKTKERHFPKSQILFCMYCSCKTLWQSVFPTEVLQWNQRTEICSIASVTDINYRATCCNLSSSSSFMYILREFLEEQKNPYFLRPRSKLCFHWLLRLCLCIFICLL